MQSATLKTQLPNLIWSNEDFQTTSKESENSKRKLDYIFSHKRFLQNQCIFLIHPLRQICQIKLLMEKKSVI